MENMEDLKNYIWKLSTDLIEDNSLFIVDVNVSEGGAKKITIKLDGDEGVSIGNCSRLSRRLGRKLEEKGEPESLYALEVTSPGLDAPLTTDRQILKNVGRLVKVKTKDGECEGNLLSVGDNSIELKTKAKKKEPAKIEIIQKNEIESIVVQVSFK